MLAAVGVHLESETRLGGVRREHGEAAERALDRRGAGSRAGASASGAERAPRPLEHAAGGPVRRCCASELTGERDLTPQDRGHLNVPAYIFMPSSPPGVLLNFSAIRGNYGTQNEGISGGNNAVLFVAMATGVITV